jgi:hypothetical protein
MDGDRCRSLCLVPVFALLWACGAASTAPSPAPGPSGISSLRITGLPVALSPGATVQLKVEFLGRVKSSCANSNPTRRHTPVWRYGIRDSGWLKIVNGAPAIRVAQLADQEFGGCREQELRVARCWDAVERAELRRLRRYAGCADGGHNLLVRRHDTQHRLHRTRRYSNLEWRNNLA